MVFSCCNPAASRFHVFTDALLHVLVEMSDYLTCFAISLKQSDQSPLTSLMNEAFSPTEVTLTGCSLFPPFSIKTILFEMVVWVNPRRSAGSEILRHSQEYLLALATTPCSKSLKTTFFPYLMLSLNFSRLPWPCLRAEKHRVAPV